MPRNARFALLLAGPLAFAACGDDPNPSDDVGTDVLVDATDDAAGDAGTDTGDDTTEDVGTDTVEDTTPDTTEDVVDADDDTDTTPPCDAGDVACSEDGRLALTCGADGTWTEEDCGALGEVCEVTDATVGCVAPWEWQSPEWEACDDHPRATTATLAEKAAYYDEIATRLHLHPDLGWVMSVTVEDREVSCPDGVEGPCFEPIPASEATYEDVRTWHSGANDGLWSALYLTAQVLRYGTTQDDEALDTIELMMESQRRRMDISGVEGIWVRAFRPPDMPSLSCPSNLDAYIPDVEKDDDRWVVIDDEGCVSTYDPEAEEFVSSDHCGMEEFAGWCFLDNVSQDEYAGHMMALAAIYQVFVVDGLGGDDERAANIVELATGMAEEVGDHLIDNELTFIDWDGRITEHGILYATALVDSPGFLAAQALGWMKVAELFTGREDFTDFYDNCLLQRTEAGRCLSWPFEDGKPYTEHLAAMLLYVGNDGCLTNFNRLSMVMANLWTLMTVENDPEVRAEVQAVLETEVFRGDTSRAMVHQRNPWFNYMYASMRSLGGADDAQPVTEVGEGTCSMREFPEDKVQRANDMSGYERYCTARLDRDGTEDPIDVADRCPSTFLWWRSPYNMDTCDDNLNRIHVPGDFLMAYWMGRYYGYIDETF